MPSDSEGGMLGAASALLSISKIWLYWVIVVFTIPSFPVMIDEVSQWLAEIQALKQQLEDKQRDLDAAYESAANWRRLYNTEAQQRRADNRLFEQQIEQLQAQIRSLSSVPDSQSRSDSILAEIEQLLTVEALRSKLMAVMQERDRLFIALQTEQENHIQTRKSLTTAIGDALDILTKERPSLPPGQIN